MNLTKKTILALGTLLAVATSNAQSTAADSHHVGVLGQDYSELSFTAQDIKHVSTEAYSLGAAVNKPLTANVDVGGGYSYSWIGGSARGHANTLTATSTAFTKFNGVKPFVGAGLGYQWASTRAGRSDYGLWGAAAGVEIPVGEFSVTPSVRYTDDFRRASRSSQDFTTSLEANYWYSKDSSVFGGVSFTDTRKSPFDTWNYTVGFRIKL